jgi:hypothetical protein
MPYRDLRYGRAPQRVLAKTTLPMRGRIMANAQAFRSLYAVGLAVLTACLFTVSSADERDLIKLSHDPYTDPAAQHATEVEPVMIAHEDTIVPAFQVGRFFGAGSDNIA